MIWQTPFKSLTVWTVKKILLITIAIEWDSKTILILAYRHCRFVQYESTSCVCLFVWTFQTRESQFMQRQALLYNQGCRGGGLIFIYSGSAQLISFERNCFYGLWTRIYEYQPPPPIIELATALCITAHELTRHHKHKVRCKHMNLFYLGRNICFLISSCSIPFQKLTTAVL